jgi:hypothetical protein
MEYCPICRARLNAAPVCRRCKAELAHAQAVEEKGKNICGMAILQLLEGNIDAAVLLFRRANFLCHTDETVELCNSIKILSKGGKPDLQPPQPIIAEAIESDIGNLSVMFWMAHGNDRQQ